MTKKQVMENHYKNNEIRNFYQEVKKSKQPDNVLFQYIRNEEGDLRGNMADKLSRLSQCLNSLLNGGELETDDPEEEENEPNVFFPCSCGKEEQGRNGEQKPETEGKTTIIILKCNKNLGKMYYK